MHYETGGGREEQDRGSVRERHAECRYFEREESGLAFAGRKPRIYRPICLYKHRVAFHTQRILRRVIGPRLYVCTRGQESEKMALPSGVWFAVLTLTSRKGVLFLTAWLFLLECKRWRCGSLLFHPRGEGRKRA